MSQDDSRDDSEGGGAVNQLTVRGFDDELNARLRRLARREGISLNQAALRLLRKGAGLADGGGGSGTVGTSLDDFIGSWTAAEADAFNAAIEDFEVIDQEMWR